jgi:hypothetical protein
MHFAVAVILNKNLSEEDIPAAVDKAMERFDFAYNAEERIVKNGSDLALKILISKEEMTLLDAKLARIGREAFEKEYGKDLTEKIEYNRDRITSKNQVQLLRDEVMTHTMFYKLDYENNLIETGNPDGKYDWFIIAGRWAKSLMVSPEASAEMGWTHSEDEKYDLVYEGRGYFGVDVCRIRHVDFEATRLGSHKLSRDEIKRQFESDENDSNASMYYGGDFEKYISVEKYSVFHSVLKEDGEWVDSEDFFNNRQANKAIKEAIVSADPESWIVVVDCHS